MRALALFLVVFTLGLDAQAVRLVRVADGLPNPTEIVSPPGDARVFVTEQRGRIRILKDGGIAPTPFLDITARVKCCGEQGLLGLAFPPQFAARQRFYVYYTDLSGNLVISRYRVTAEDRDRADPNSEQVLVRIPHPDFTNHNGGHLEFGPDGWLYTGTGDGGSGGDPRGNGQNRNVLLGKLLRMDVENNDAPQPEMFAYGLRNPWKFAFDKQTGDLFIADVGQSTLEEVNYQAAPVQPGVNYGWNRMEGTRCYSPSSGCDQSGLTLPIHEYPRSVGVSITGGHVYRGRSIPALAGAYVFGDYGRGQVWALRRAGSNWQNEQLVASGLQLSTFGLDSAGEMYVGSYGEGAVYRIVPTAGAMSAVSAASFAEGGLVPGSLATLFGPGIAPVVGILPATSFPLPTSAANTYVTLNGTRVPLLAVANANGQDQINFQVPWELAGQTRATLVVNVNGQATAPVELPIATARPDIFTVQMQPGAWTIWATGLGSVSNAPGTGQPAPASPLARTAGDTTVTVGGVEAQVFYSGLSPNFAGLYQVNIIPPASYVVGDEIVIRVNGVAGRPWRIPAQP